MKKIQLKIQSNSKNIYLLLLLLTFFIAFSSVLKTYDIVMQNFQCDTPFLASPDSLSDFIHLLQQYFLLPLLLFIALTFHKISISETPFFHTLCNRLKTISFLTFFSIALPRWIGYIIYSSINHTLEFALLDNLLIIAFILSSIIFSVAQIFEYGTLLQNENDEIL